MPVIAKAECIDRREINDNIRFAEFVYEYYHDGRESSELTFDLVMVDHEFETVWTIHRSFEQEDRNFNLYWNKITIEKCNHANAFGSFIVHVENSSEFVKSTFFTSSLPYEKDIHLVYCTNYEFIKITVQIYREHEKSSFIEACDRLIGNQNLSDITFVVQNEEIPACKSILSSYSHVFASMFSSGMKEEQSSRVEIIDIEPTIFKLFLRYIYCGRVESTDIEKLLKLVIAADKYSVKSLVDLCAYRISMNLSVDTAVDALIVSDIVSAKFFKKECIRFIVENKHKVVDTKSYEAMVKTHAHLLSEIFRQIDHCELRD